MCVINNGYPNGSAEYSNNARHRTCLHHFHPSVITLDSKDRNRLKIRLDPTMCLSWHAVENNLHKENINLPIIMNLLEDLQHTHNFEIKIEKENNTHFVATITPTIDSQNKN